MSRFVYLILLACLVSSTLLFGAAEDSPAVSTLTQHSDTTSEALVEANLELKPAGDSTTDDDLNKEAITTSVGRSASEFLPNVVDEVTSPVAQGTRNLVRYGKFSSAARLGPIEGDPQLVQDAQVEPRPRLSNRLLLTGTLVVVLLGQLSVLFGYLKINHATRGFYGGRLQSFSAVASVVVIAAGYFFYMTWKI